MSFIIWIVLGSIALFIATKMVGRRTHILVPAVLAIAGLGWASASSAAPSDAWITTEAKMALLVAEDVSATAVR